MLDLTQFKALSLDGVPLESLRLNGVEIWRKEAEAAYTNLVGTSIAEDGSVYNGVGYADGYRVSSSGEIKTQSGTPLTGYIQCEGINDASVIRTKGVQFVTGLYCGVVFYDADFNLIHGIRFPAGTTLASGTAAIVYTAVDGTASTEREDGVTEITFNFNEAVLTENPPTYFRLFAQGEGADMIVTVNEEIT